MDSRFVSLTAADERDTALRIQVIEDRLRRLTKGADMAATPALAPTRRAEIDALRREAQALRWRLALSAEHVARREARRHAAAGVATDDLHQEGVLGLLAAVTRFDPSRGVRFACYARRWVRAQINRALGRSDVLAVASGAAALSRKYRYLVQRDQRNGVRRGLIQAAEELGVEPQRLIDVIAATSRQQVEVHDDDDGPCALDRLVDERTQSPEETVLASNLGARVRAAISTMFDDRQRFILENRYGLGVEPAAIAHIAARLSLSPERIRQVDQQCLEALRGNFSREMAL